VVDLPLRRSLTGEYVSATVEIDGGGVAVEHEVAGPAGFDRAPCASGASANVTLPMGTTDVTGDAASAREVLVFFNPFPADAVLDVRFSTDRGERGTPEKLKGFVVPGRSVVGVDLAAAGVTVSDDVATEVAARTGRVVVDRLQTYAGFDGRRGLILSGGVPAPAESWVFPAGTLSATRREILAVYNPNDVAADLDVEVRPGPGASVATEPFQITVQPHRHARLDLSTEDRMKDFVAQSLPYTLVVRSADGTPISAERLVTVEPGTAGGGVGSGTGSALASQQVLADLTGAQAGSVLVLSNPSPDSVASVELRVLSGGTRQPAATASVDLEPGERRAIPVEQLGAGPVLASSNVPVVAAAEVVVGADRADTVGIPDAATASIAEPPLFDALDLGG
jgi:hypothetical protein